MILGLIGVGSSLFHNFTAKHGAHRMIEHAKGIRNEEWDHESHHHESN